MAHVEAKNWTRRVASVVKRSCSISHALESLCIIEVKDLFSTQLPSKSSTAG